MKFGLGGPCSPNGGTRPPRGRALYGHPRGAHSGERTVSIRAAVTEKNAFEQKSLAPPSGETKRGWGSMSRVGCEVVEGHNV